MTVASSENKVNEYTLADFEYELPAELIAQEPLPSRDQSRLMLVERSTGAISHRQFSDIAQALKPGDLVVVNDTKVIPARISARRVSGGLVEILLLRPEAGKSGLWQAMATPMKRLKVGETLTICHPEERSDEGPVQKARQATSHERSFAFAQDDKVVITIHDIVTADDGHKRLILDLGTQEDVYNLLSGAGFAPLPPYIHRNGQEEKRAADLERYQTVFASAPGAVAAPTAGLHFSEKLLAQLSASGIEVCKITLHVGPGTFKPIASSLVDHQIESEIYSIPERTASLVNSAITESRRVIAVGTTSCRALESAGGSRLLQPVMSASTSLYIRPGYDFKIVDGLVTNFHLSKSSLLVLVSTFAGHDLIMRAYDEAIKERYRFFSYGDAMLIV